VDKLTVSKITATFARAVYCGVGPGMSDDETVSRRQLFSGWARGLRDGLAEWVLPELEREAERLREAFDATGVTEDSPAVESVHPWRDLLEPREDDAST